MAKSIVIGLLGTIVVTAYTMADIQQGEAMYQKRLQPYCHFSVAIVAMKHTQDEWEMIKGAGKFEAELIKICPSLRQVISQVPKEEINDLYDFFYEYASDSGNIPPNS